MFDAAVDVGVRSASLIRLPLQRVYPIPRDRKHHAQVLRVSNIDLTVCLEVVSSIHLLFVSNTIGPVYARRSEGWPSIRVR